MRFAFIIILFLFCGQVGAGEAKTSDPAVPSSANQSRKTPPESYHDVNVPLAGKAGLDAAVAKGLIRKATPADADKWTKAVSGAIQALPPTDRQKLPKPRRMPLYNAYVVLKPFTFPAGLSGAHLAVFFIEKGVPAPKGDPGHSFVYDFNAFSCGVEPRDGSTESD